MNSKSAYKNKLFSILGDSMSALEGYSIPELAAYYTSSRCYETGILIPSDTWWGQLIDELDAKLLVNNSFAGSTVSYDRSYEIQSYGCSQERTESLGKNGIDPNIIMILMGYNDWGRGKKVHPDSENSNDLSIFSVAYKTMLNRIKTKYPEATLWCFTLPVSAYSKREGYEFPYYYGGIHIEEYNEVIRNLSNSENALLIDLYNTCEPFDTVDGFHPNAQGMITLASAVKKCL